MTRGFSSKEITSFLFLQIEDQQSFTYKICRFSHPTSFCMKIFSSLLDFDGDKGIFEHRDPQLHASSFRSRTRVLYRTQAGSFIWPLFVWKFYKIYLTLTETKGFSSKEVTSFIFLQIKDQSFTAKTSGFFHLTSFCMKILFTWLWQRQGVFEQRDHQLHHPSDQGPEFYTWFRIWIRIRMDLH